MVFPAQAGIQTGSAGVPARILAPAKGRRHYVNSGIWSLAVDDGCLAARKCLLSHSSWFW